MRKLPSLRTYTIINSANKPVKVRSRTRWGAWAKVMMKENERN